MTKNVKPPELPDPDDIEIPDAFDQGDAPVIEDDEEEPGTPESDDTVDDDEMVDELGAGAEPDADHDEDDDDFADGKLPERAYKAVMKARRARKTARSEAREARETATRLLEENEALKAEKDDPEPDPSEDAQAYKDWAKRSAERTLKIRRDAGTPKDPEAARIGAMADEMRSRHRDYDQVVNPAVRNQIHTSPKLYKRVYGSKNPAQAAYELGKELLGEDDEPVRRPRQPGTGGSGGYAPTRRQVSGEKLDPGIKKLGRIFGVSDKDMAKGIAARQGRN